jgi:SNF2 family DNA or RNA helicase
MIDLLETLLVRYGIQNLRYDRKMQSKTHEAALLRFRKTGRPRVILISIKCGSIRLNV